MSLFKNLSNGLVKENPVFALYLGLCSVLAVSNTISNALGMSVAVIIVLTVSNVIISALRKIIPSEIRIPVYIVVIATLVKIVEMLMQAYTPELYTALGVFIPLIVVNCIILGRAEAFASKNSVGASAIDGIGMGLGYTAGIFMLAAIRQLFATGALSLINPFNQAVIFDITIIPTQFTIPLFAQPAGAFITFAVLAALLEVYKQAGEKPAKKGA
ncbi:MAG: electron transport complex subunit E [Erysipelothrix sp.]|jgi:electron transport complex protein RnfE|nr:electron transport complex subunit E [Erysipelothrix sp.]